MKRGSFHLHTAPATKYFEGFWKEENLPDFLAPLSEQLHPAARGATGVYTRCTWTDCDRSSCERDLMEEQRRFASLHQLVLFWAGRYVRYREADGALSRSTLAVRAITGLVLK